MVTKILKIAVPAVLVLLSVWMRFSLYPESGSENVLRGPSALDFHYAKLSAEGKEIPETEPGAMYPEGMNPAASIRLAGASLSAFFYRCWPGSAPFNEFLPGFLLFLSGLSIGAAFLTAHKLTHGNIFACSASAVLYLAAFPPQIFNAGGIISGSTALPLIFFSFYFFLRAVERGAKKLFFSAASGILLVLGLVSSGLSGFYFSVFLAFTTVEFFVRYEERDQLVTPFLIITGFNLLAGLLSPILRAEGFAYSYAMLLSYCLVLTWVIFKGTNSNKLISLSVFGGLSLFVVATLLLL
jgi:hypothetical protein